MRINTKSIIFRTALVYLFITLLNVSVFILMVFENQLDLIAENAILNSQRIGSNLKHQIDDILDREGELSEPNLERIVKAAQILGIGTLTLFLERGDVLMAINSGRDSSREDASPTELRMINMAITKKDFEQKLFFHEIHRDRRLIDLYIPFDYAVDQIAVAAISLEMKDIEKQMGYLYRQCLLIALLIIAIHGLFAFAISKMLIIPLNNLLTATQSVSRGDLEVRVPIVRDDEIGRLASSFNEMSVAIKRMRDEAKGANPLTELPGNITIARIIEESLEIGRKIAVLYCDLDNFKAYNDKYGFSRGDDAILYTRDCLLQAARGEGVDNVFVGHQGGDDFVVVCDFPYWETFAKSFIRTFDKDVRQFYNKTDARNGYIDSINRQGERQRFPLMSISVAVVTNKDRTFTKHTEMIKVAAEVKKHAKSLEGSSYAIDRRSGESSMGDHEDRREEVEGDIYSRDIIASEISERRSRNREEPEHVE
jgi:diguanylate cyclase (GGDEF)-like protein